MKPHRVKFSCSFQKFFGAKLGRTNPIRRSSNGGGQFTGKFTYETVYKLCRLGSELPLAFDSEVGEGQGGAQLQQFHNLQIKPADYDWFACQFKVLPQIMHAQSVN